MSYQRSFADEVGVSCLSLLNDIYSILSCPLALKLLSFASVDAVFLVLLAKIVMGTLPFPKTKAENLLGEGLFLLCHTLQRSFQEHQITTPK